MKRMKRIGALLLAVTLLLSLGACARGQNNLPSAPEAGASAVQETTAPSSDPLDKMVEAMSLEEKVGQMFYVCCVNESVPDWLQNYHIGGLILFGADFEEKTADEVRSTISGYQKASKLPLLIGVDEEGGTVVRLSDNPNLRDTAFPSPKEVYQDGGWEAIDATEAEKADLLLSLGINVNMAPVCDVTSNTESFMFDRSFSGDVNEVNTFVTKTVNICKEKRLGTVLKHFPGYGDNTDTHDDMAYDSRSYEAFQKTDYLPFKAGVAAGADCILTAHTIVAGMDDKTPASLSKKVHESLRADLGFDGVIMTDDLAMEAIGKYAGADAAAVAAAKCGNDLLCCSDVETQYPAVMQAVKKGDIPEAQVDASVKRILRWKQNLGLLNTQ